MIRTTDTGGVKMIYNGEAVNNQCLSNRENHVGYEYLEILYLNSNYWYGTDYIYDTTSQTFKLSGTMEETTWNETTGPNLIGKYTCVSADPDAACKTLYLVEHYETGQRGYLSQLNSNSNYSQFGKMEFNVRPDSITDIGYMHNTEYSYGFKQLPSTETVLSIKTLYSNRWYADNIVWGDPVANKYSLVNPYKESSNYQSLVGKYTLGSTNQSFTNDRAYYISGVVGPNMYYVELKNGNNIDNYSYTYGDNYTDNGNGTYTINNPTTMNSGDWYSNHNSLKNKYVCKNALNNTCNDVWYVTSTSDTEMKYIPSEKNYKYARGYTYDSNTDTYTLNNDTANYWMPTTNARYTCFNTSGKCNKIYYIYMSETINYTPYYIALSEGKSVEDALDEMLTVNSVNTTESTVKMGIEKWYEHYLLDYSNYLEDTIFCNNRTVESLGGWDPNGDNFNSLLFKEYNVTNDLSCTSVTDKFSISNNKAKLTYKVGLMTSSEMNLLNNSNARKSGQNYWLATPRYFSGERAGSYTIDTNGNFYSYAVSTSQGLRPAISLIPGIKYLSGDGSMETPYVIDTSS